MDLNLIGLFVEIVEARSLSAAARKLGMTRANVSQRLKLLERETGAQLLRRSTRSFELTQAGSTLYDSGRRIVEELGTARASIDSLGKTLRGRVRISVPTGFGRLFAGAKLLEFARANPGIALTVTFNNWIEDLIAAEVDVALRITSTPPLDCVARKICSFEWSLCASADYLREQGPIERPADLEQHALICAPYGGRRVPIELLHRENAADTHTITVPPALESTDYPFLAEAVREGMGIGVLPDYVIHLQANRDLLPVLQSYRVVGRQSTLYIVTLPNRYPSPATQVLIDFLHDQILELAQSWK
ncbi:LysR family transcriptional regulator [Paraburkholderia sp. A1RI-2L]|uniref:LysR family transcriptional regulator n=1 Tax=Paraburkholderia sp. A1RI-2L TaxID=3028367 RepID=UPI003B78CF3E